MEPDAETTTSENAAIVDPTTPPARPLSAAEAARDLAEYVEHELLEVLSKERRSTTLEHLMAYYKADAGR